ncbi:allergen Tha p 1-like [Zerene cesonia]|uniref:allergen Tha p 1-like n=1 Tax=Zerene cesonia TaxID=33412 RepID=UPI0018E54998|nr:allergen Tha p 1-like [Zerene cesonia]
MFKYVVLFASVVMLVSSETYSTENDDIDIEGVVNDVNNLKAFINCFNDKGECNEAAADFKNDLGEAFETACLKCTEAQKHIFKRFLDEAKVKLPEEYAYFLQKYDSEGKYIEPLKNAIASF